MGATPTTSNAVVGFFDGLAKAILAGGQDAAKAFILTTPAAWLYAPVMSLITEYFIGLLAQAIYTQASNIIAMAVISVQTDLEKSKVGSAVTNLQAAHATGDTNAINEANTQFDQAVASLIHSDGSTPAVDASDSES